MGTIMKIKAKTVVKVRVARTVKNTIARPGNSSALPDT